jgi:protein FrlC
MALIRREQLVGMNQHYKKFSLDYFLDAQQRVGFQNIELWLGAPHFWLDSISYDDCKVVKKKTVEHGLQVVSVTSPSMAYQYQYASQEKYQFERSIKYFSNGIKATAELGANIMTVNSGWGYWNEGFDIAFARSKEMINQLCDIAASEGIVLVLESLTSVESNIVNNIITAKRMFDEINNPVLKIMVDTVATGFAKETTSYWFEVFGKDLIHMHFIDGNYRSDAHYIWGDGEYLLEKEIQNLNDNNYIGYLVQEIMDEKYLSNPMLADMENMKMLLKFVDD